MKDCFFLPGSSPQKDPHVWAGKLLVSREGSLGIPSQIVWVSFLWGKDLLGLLSPMGCFKYLGCPSKKEGALQESFSMNFLVEKLTIQHCDGPPYLLTHPLSGKTPTRSPWTAQRAHRNLSHPKRNAKRTPFKKVRPQDWGFVDLRWSLTLQWHFSGSAPSLSKTPLSKRVQKLPIPNPTWRGRNSYAAGPDRGKIPPWIRQLTLPSRQVGDPITSRNFWGDGMFQ